MLRVELEIAENVKYASARSVLYSEFQQLILYYRLLFCRFFVRLECQVRNWQEKLLRKPNRFTKDAKK